MYITEEEGRNLSFNYSFKQTFYRDPKRSRGMPEYIIVSEFMKGDDTHRQVGLEILTYLRQFCFATRDMLGTMLASKGLDVSILDEILDLYLEKYLINFFTISAYNMGEVPEDAMKIYCLDSGAIYILTHFSTTDSISWLSSDNIRSVELVTKYLATGLFASTLVQNKGKAVSAFIPVFDASIGKRMIRFSAAFTVMNGYTPLNYVLETVRGFDLPGPWMKKCGEQISVFSNGKHWQKYFDQEPGYVLLCENEVVAKDAAVILGRGMGDQEIRLITDGYFNGEPNSVFEFDRDKKILVPIHDKSFFAG